MGCYTNKPPGEKDNPAGTIIPIVLLVLFAVITITGIILTAPKCPEKLVTKVDKYEEVVKEITYHHSFWDGNYCIIVTDKNFHTVRGETCINNKVGEQFTYTYGEYVEVCGEDK